ncbi:MAG: M28 family metallopeptidase [Anaerolineales bacterium]
MIAFSPALTFDLPYWAGALVLGIAGWISHSFPWLALALPFLFMILPQASRWWVQRRKPTRFSENLLAWIGRDMLDSPPSLLFCAHVDTARAVPFKNPELLRLHSRTLDILQRFAWMLFALALLQLWGWQVVNVLRYSVATLGSLGGLWLIGLQLAPLYAGEELAYSPGANDNASGVGVLLAIAEELAACSEQEPSLAFLFTTAEESGLYGARDFVATHSAWAETTSVVCVDMVGRGEMLYYVAKEGVLNPIYTSSELGQMLRQTNPNL